MVLILIVIPRSSAATGTRHSNCNLSRTRSHEIPRSSAAIGSFILKISYNFTLNLKIKYNIIYFF